MIGTLGATMTTPGDSAASGGPAAAPALADRLAQLREQIRTAHLRAGRPSYREISRSTGHAVSHTTVSKIIRCDSPPAWASLKPVLDALGADVETVRELWVALHQPQAAPACPQAGTDAVSAPALPVMGGTQDRPDSLPAARRARRSSRRSQTTVFTMGTDLYMTDFYDFLASRIAAARHCVYITGEGVTVTDSEPLHPELAAAPWTALRNGAHVVRVQTSPDVSDYWLSQLCAMITEFPQTFELRALATPVNVTRVNLCAIDVDDPDRNVAEMMLQTARYLGTQRLNLATTAVFVEGHQLLAQSFRDQILDLGTTAPAEHLTSGPAVERFFRGEHYFAYGSNMDQAQMTQRCPSAMLIGPAALPGHRLVFNRSGTYRPGGVANLQPSPGHRVYGTLWKLSADDLCRLDDTEDPRAYHRSTLTVHSLTGQPYPGTHVYAAIPDRDDGAPDAQYLELLITAGRAAGLPPEYLQELTARRATPG
jgi:hypothetical protein